MDGIELDVRTEPVKVFRVGDTSGDLAAGRKLLVRAYSSGPNEELLDYQVPDGKVAHIDIAVNIVETDV